MLRPVTTAIAPSLRASVDLPAQYRRNIIVPHHTCRVSGGLLTRTLLPALSLFRMEWLYRNVSSLQAALQQAPETLRPVSVDFSANILYRVVYHFVLKFIEPVVGLKRVSKDRGPGQHVVAYLGLQGLFLGVVHTLYADATIQWAVRRATVSR
jgi:hypothetical protein